MALSGESLDVVAKSTARDEDPLRSGQVLGREPPEQVGFTAQVPGSISFAIAGVPVGWRGRRCHRRVHLLRLGSIVARLLFLDGLEKLEVEAISVHVDR